MTSPGSAWKALLGSGSWGRVGPAGLSLDHQQSPRDGASVLCLHFVDQSQTPALQPLVRAGGTESNQVWLLGSPSKDVRSQFTVSFASLEPLACGRRTFRYVHCRWRSRLKCRFKKSVGEQKFGNRHCSQSSVKSERCEAALEC